MRKWCGLLLALALCLSSPCLWARAQPIDYRVLSAMVKAGKTSDFEHALAGKSARDLNSEGRTLLMTQAIDGGHADILNILLRLGVDPNGLMQVEQSGQRVQVTPLLLAVSARDGRATAAVLIAAGADPNLGAEALLPLHLALSLGRLELAGDLLDHGAQAGKVDGSGFTALMELALGADDANSATATMAQRLVTAGVEVNARGPQGSTALRWAVLGSKSNLVKALLAAHADPNSANDKGETVLQLALRKQFAEIAALLRNAGARP